MNASAIAHRQRSEEHALRDAIRPIDELLVQVARHARVLPATAAGNGESERVRLIAAVARGEAPRPEWQLVKRPVPRGLFVALDEARALAADRLPRTLASMYASRFDELEVDLSMLAAIGDPVRIRPLAARRYGSGISWVDL